MREAKMNGDSYLTLELEDGENITFNRATLKYLPLLELAYEEGDTVIEDDEDFQLPAPLWQLIKDIITEFDVQFGTLVGPQTMHHLTKTELLKDVQLYDIYRMLRVMYHYKSSLLLDLLLSHLVERLLPLNIERLTLQNPRLGKKPARGIAESLVKPTEIINESYSVIREVLMTIFDLYLDTFDLIERLDDRYLPQVLSVLASGDNHVALLTQSGLLMKGNNQEGELGVGLADTDPTRWYSLIMKGVISVWCGSHYTMILTTEGLFACGSNEYGQLGLENRLGGRRVFSPLKLNLPQVLSVACGVSHTLVLTVEGVFGFGRNNHSELGMPALMRVYIPHLVNLEERMTAVACGDHYSLFLSEGGNVYHCGLSMTGIPVNTQRPTKVPLPKEAGRITAIFAGTRHALMLNEDREVFIWGANGDGQLGIDHTKQWQPEVIKHPTLTNIVNAAACHNWSAFINSQGELFVTGDNTYNQLGLIGNSTASPVKVDISNVITLACGRHYSEILTCDGLFRTGGEVIERQEIAKVAEGPICKPKRTALHCHVCGSEHDVDVSLKARREHQLCSSACYERYTQFRVPY